MPEYYNALGSSTVNGTTGKDLFFAFTKDNNFDHVRPDATLASLVWDTAIKRADGTAYQIVAANIQVSSDLLAGGDGTDIIYGSNLADALLFNNGVISGGIGSWSSIEQFWLGEGDDVVDLSAHGPGGINYGKSTIQGEGGNDTLIGGSGKDAIYGGAGNDFLVGYIEADTLYGGSGDDIIYGDDMGANIAAGMDLLDGGDGNDILYGGGRNDQLLGGAGNDILYGQSGGDNLSGGAGDDILYGDDADTSSNDILNGDGGNDQLYGGGGDDEMYGNADNDLLDGGTGNDYMSGGAGNDTLIAGAGNDLLDGGLDTDTAVFSGNRADYLFTLNADGSYTVVDTRAGSPDGTDTIRNLEWLTFADGTISGTQINYAPVITSNGGGAAAALSILENDTAVTTVTATDADPGQTPAFSISGGADAAFFTIDAATGALAFANAPNFENPADADHDNVYQVIVAANDGSGGIDTQSLSVTVQDVLDSFAPVITSNGGGTTASVSVAENSAAVTTVVATDQDGPATSYAIIGGADAALFSLNAANGQLVFNAAPDYENPADANHDGIYDVIVAASDGANTDQQSLAVTVTNENDNIPVITSNGGGATAAIAIAENITAITTVTATDADGTAPTFSIAGGPDAALFTLDTITGQLAFVTAPDYENPSDSNGDRIYQVIVQANDGVASVSQALAISITNVNDNTPIIGSNGGAATGTLSIAENSAAVTTVAAADADGTVPAYALAGGADAALFQINAATGALSFLTAPDYENKLDANANGVYEVIVRASDGINFDDQALSIAVTDVNEVGKTITGSSGSNSINPTQTVIGYQTTALNDTIYGLAGNDIIDGGGGADYMDGGIGNDSFYVDSFSDDGFAGNDDQVIEAAGGGTDLVNASVSYRMAAEVENLTLIGAAAINGTGNALSNVITGNAAANVLTGDLGNDTLNGMAGNDTLSGGDGTDILNGGADDDTLFGGIGTDLMDGGTGADLMDGGADNDTYYVDTWSDDGNALNDDRIVELAGGGTADLVNASVSYRLDAQVERLTLTGTAAINGTGNDLDNVINGNSAANTLSGGLGNDTLNGGDGNDRLLGEDGSDTLDGGLGNDTLEGGAASDTLNGKEGDDFLFGGVGKDTLTGGAGADSFFFNFGDTSQSASSLDKINDFGTGVDKIDLSNVTGTLAAAAYSESTVATNNYADALTLAKTMMGPGKVAAFVAGTTDGWLFWDGNGDGLIDQAITLGGLNTLAGFTSGDIL